MCVLLYRIISASLAEFAFYSFVGNECCFVLVVVVVVVYAGSFDAGFKLIIQRHDSPKSNYLLLTQKQRDGRPCPSHVATLSAHSACSPPMLMLRVNGAAEGRTEHSKCVPWGSAAVGDGRRGSGRTRLRVVVCIQFDRVASRRFRARLSRFLTAFRVFSLSSGLGIVTQSSAKLLNSSQKAATSVRGCDADRSLSEGLLADTFGCNLSPAAIPMGLIMKPASAASPLRGGRESCLRSPQSSQLLHRCSRLQYQKIRT